MDNKTYKEKYNEGLELAKSYYGKGTNEFLDTIFPELKAKEDKTYEVCPQCGEEVELDAELKVQTCPSCGARIATCSMCRPCDETDSNYCTNCVLCRQAKIENDELRAMKLIRAREAGEIIMDDTNSHNSKLVDTINDLWKKSWGEKDGGRLAIILKALMKRDTQEMLDKGYVSSEDAMPVALANYQHYAYDYLMHIADDMDLQTIIFFMRDARAYQKID